MDALTDAWRAFCGNSFCADQDGGGLFLKKKKDGGGFCGFGKLFHSSTCLNRIFVSSIDVVLVVAFMLNFVCKVARKSVGGRLIFSLPSLWRIISAALNSLLGLACLGRGLWMLIENLRTGMGIQPSHQCLVLLAHGFCLLLIALTVIIKHTQVGYAFIRIWSLAAALSIGFECLTSIVVVLAEKKTYFLFCVDVLSLPGAVILLLCVFKVSNRTDDYKSLARSLYEPLKGESSTNEESSDGFVTPFENAGFFSRMSFQWLNPLMKQGYHKPLEENDIPQLGPVDKAENCYLFFLEQLNQQKRRQGTTSPSIFWSIVSCYRKEILMSGFFALLKILNLLAGPVLLNAFIKVSSGNGVFKHEGYVLALGLFCAKCLESLSQRQWYFRTRRLGLQIRSLLSAAIYQKQLKLSNKAKLVHSSGEIMNYVMVTGN